MNANLKTALVTGGSKGIGRATVKKLLQKNCRVITCGRNQDNWKNAVNEDNELAQVDFYTVDLFDEAELNEFFNTIKNKYNRVDIAVNNAAAPIAAKGNFADLEIETIRRNLENDLWMPLLCLKKEIKLMTAGGAIVNVTSTSGITPLPYTATYGCAKAGIESLTKSLALELVPRNIRVNAVAPGITMTPRWKERAEAAGTEAIYEEASTQIPLRRFATPEEVANGIVWLASDEASYVVGHTLVIDGGFLLGNI